MEFGHSETDKDVLIVAADEKLNEQTAAQFAAELGKLIEGGPTKLIIDCTRLEFLSSCGIGTLVSLRSKLVERGGGIKLVAVNRAIQQTFYVSGLAGMFKSYDNIQQAQAAFSSNA
jgi:anti-sigma B factor antagonist